MSKTKNATLTLKVGKKETSIKLNEYEMGDAIEFLEYQRDMNGNDCELMQKFFSILNGTPYEPEKNEYFVTLTINVKAGSNDEATQLVLEKLGKMKELQDVDVTDTSLI